MDISNLLDAQFKILVIRMLQELIGYFNDIKKTQAEMQVTLSEIKKNLQGINTGVDKAENQISDLEHKEEKNSIRTERKKKNKKNEDRVGSLWDNFKHSNIHIMAVLEGEEK